LRQLWITGFLQTENVLFILKITMTLSVKLVCLNVTVDNARV